MPPTIQILGLRFLHGSAQQAVDQVSGTGGVLVVPAAPALVRLQRDAIYRQAMLSADYAIPDSGLMVLSWKILRGASFSRVSGLAYLESLIRRPEFAETMFFVLPSAEAQRKLLAWSANHHLSVTMDDCYVAPFYAQAVEDRDLLGRLAQRRPGHVVIAIGNGPQEKLGVYLRDHLAYRPAIHCIGAALGFLTGDQVAIPGWADRFYLGWLLRLLDQPRIFIPRLARAALLPWLVLRFGSEMPPLRGKESLNHGLHG
ncbi:MAG TPA: WecB/TagA/CpsF family glycosyltransferase [Chthoniobacterales bacterium]